MSYVLKIDSLNSAVLTLVQIHTVVAAVGLVAMSVRYFTSRNDVTYSYVHTQSQTAALSLTCHWIPECTFRCMECGSLGSAVWLRLKTFNSNASLICTLPYTYLCLLPSLTHLLTNCPSSQIDTCSHRCGSLLQRKFTNYINCLQASMQHVCC